MLTRLKVWSFDDFLKSTDKEKQRIRDDSKSDAPTRERPQSKDTDAVFQVIKKNRFGVAKSRYVILDKSQNVLKEVDMELRIKAEHPFDQMQRIVVENADKFHLKIEFKKSTHQRPHHVVFETQSEFTKFEKSLTPFIKGDDEEKTTDTTTPSSHSRRVTVMIDAEDLQFEVLTTKIESKMLGMRKRQKTVSRVLGINLKQKVFRILDPDARQFEMELQLSQISKLKLSEPNDQGTTEMGLVVGLPLYKRFIMHFSEFSDAKPYTVWFTDVFAQNYFCGICHEFGVRIETDEYKDRFYQTEEETKDGEPPRDFRLSVLQHTGGTAQERDMRFMYFYQHNETVSVLSPSEIVMFKLDGILEYEIEENGKHPTGLMVAFEPCQADDAARRNSLPKTPRHRQKSRYSKISNEALLDIEFNDFKPDEGPELNEMELYIDFMTVRRRDRFIQLIDDLVPLETPKREDIKKEIIASEDKYTEQLVTLSDKFMNPLKRNKIIKEKYIEQIFSSIESLVSFHRIFLAELQTEPNIPQVFDKYADYFLLSKDYVATYDNRLRALEKLNNHKKFQQFQKELAQKGLRNLMSYLITPVQRIPRYILLLEDLKKNTPKRHPEYGVLDDQCEKLTHIGITINENLRRVQAMEKLLRISRKINGEMEFSLVQPHRALIREGELQQRTISKRRKKVKIEDRIGYLFSDLLLWTNLKSEFIGYRDLHKQDVYSLGEDNSDDFGFEINKSTTSDVSGNMGIMEVLESHSDDAIKFICESEVEQKGWVSSIKETLAALPGISLQVSPLLLSMKNNQRTSSLLISTTPSSSSPLSSRPRSLPRLRASSPRASSPRASSPRASSPRASSPRASSPRASSPRAASPRSASPRSTSPKNARASSPKAQSSPRKSPKSSFFKARPASPTNKKQDATSI